MIDTNRFYIDGQWVAPHGKDTFATIDPATEAVTGHLAMGATQDADAAVAAAHRAFDAWSSITRETRLDLLTRLLELYNAGAEEMSQWMTTEMGVASGFSPSAQIALGRAHLEPRFACCAISRSRSSAARPCSRKSRSASARSSRRGTGR